MPRLIDANKLRKEVDRLPNSSPWSRDEVYRVDVEDIVELAPTVDAVPVITADEMFRELGYTKSDKCLYITHNPNPTGGKLTVIEVFAGCVKKWGYGPKGGIHHFELTVEELLASAQLIKEMEAEQ